MVAALTEARKEQGITQKELSEKTGVSRVCISRYESGKHHPSYENARKLSLFFGKTMEELFDRKAG